MAVFYSKPPPALATFVHYNVLSSISLKLLFCSYRFAQSHTPPPHPNSSLEQCASAGLIGCTGGGGIAHNYEVEMALRSSGIMDESLGAGLGFDSPRARHREDGADSRRLGYR